ncbi:MAG: DUF4340 domain-containing protein [Anaerolineales bacterium]|nr:DUF4340 domain-containing protein [Anaerolineales bacterium]
MNRNTTLILLGIFALLLIYVLLTQNAAPGSASATSTLAPTSAVSGPLWSGVTADQVLRVHVTNRVTNKSVAFGRDSVEASWSVSEPETQPADQLTAANNVATLVNLQYRNLITATTDLSVFGVLSPTHRLEIGLVDGRTLKLVVGDKTVTGMDYYVQREGEATVLVVNSFSLDPILGWVENPPYLPPTSTPEPAEMPTPGADSTPTGTVSP